MQFGCPFGKVLLISLTKYQITAVFVEQPLAKSTKKSILSPCICVDEEMDKFVVDMSDENTWAGSSPVYKSSQVYKSLQEFFTGFKKFFLCTEPVWREERGKSSVGGEMVGCNKRLRTRFTISRPTFSIPWKSGTSLITIKELQLQ